MREKVILVCSECLSRNYTMSVKKEGTSFARSVESTQFTKLVNRRSRLYGR